MIDKKGDELSYQQNKSELLRLFSKSQKSTEDSNVNKKS
jgi:hypothetical protein